MKTYVVNQKKSYKMKFSFLHIISIITFSACVSGDLEIYPGNSNLDNADYRVESSYPSWSHNIDDYVDDNKKIASSLAERYRNLERILTTDWNQKSSSDDFPYFPNVANLYEIALRQYQNRFNNEGKSNSRFFPNWVDGRPYTSLDNSFVFENGNKIEKMLHQNFQRHALNQDNNNNQEDTSINEKFEVKLVGDPEEFAYPPSDPRFFQDVDDHVDVDSTREVNDFKNIQIQPRSEETISEFTETDFTDSVFDDGDERKVNSPVKVVAIHQNPPISESAGVYIIAIVAGISAAATVGLIAVGIGWYNLQKHVKNASDVEYPAYGVTGPNKDSSPSGDRRLAQSAQMYHYQHQKQQIIAMESRAAASDRHGSVSEADTDEENEEGDYTVYECPGLAPTGEMEVKNPLFHDDPTPSQTPNKGTTTVDEKK